MTKETRIKSFVRLMNLGETKKAEKIYYNPQFQEEFKEAKELINKEKKSSEKASESKTKGKK